MVFDFPPISTFIHPSPLKLRLHFRVLLILGLIHHHLLTRSVINLVVFCGRIDEGSIRALDIATDKRHCSACLDHVAIDDNVCAEFAAADVGYVAIGMTVLAQLYG